jgi:hypothetical protein
VLNEWRILLHFADLIDLEESFRSFDELVLRSLAFREGKLLPIDLL